MLYPPGTKVGKFEIKSELGRGAMGVVYVARDPVLERDVALKVMAATILEDDDLKKRFLREAQAVAKLQSPNIVTVYDFGHDRQKSPYIAMELLSGTDLEAKIQTDPPPLSAKINIIIQVCRGLDHAHRHGIIHRDVKPANIFLTRSGLVKIMDFGTARLIESSQTQTGTIMGTVAYMSPEQIQGQKVDGRADIFSLGVVFYRLLCHQQPFGGENVHHMIYKILNVQPASLALPDGVTVPPLQLIIDRALAKDASQRYQTAEEMADDLTRFLQDHAGSLSDDTVFRTVPLGDVAASPPPLSGAPGRPEEATIVLGSKPEEAPVREQPAAVEKDPALRGGSGERRPGVSPIFQAAAAAAVLGAFAAGAFLVARLAGRDEPVVDSTAAEAMKQEQPSAVEAVKQQQPSAVEAVKQQQPSAVEAVKDSETLAVRAQPPPPAVTRRPVAAAPPPPFRSLSRRRRFRSPSPRRRPSRHSSEPWPSKRRSPAASSSAPVS